MASVDTQRFATSAPAALARSSCLGSQHSSLNDATAKLLIAFVALVPIPLGSNRPFFWAFNAAIIGLMAVGYSWRLSRLGERFRIGLRQLRQPAVLFLFLCAYVFVQTLPIGRLPIVGEMIRGYLEITSAHGAVVNLDTISVTPDASLLMLLRWVSYGVFFFLVLQVAANQSRKNLLLHAALAIVTVYAFVGLASLYQFGDTILGVQKWAYEGSATATFVNRNSFATFLAFGAVVAVALASGTFISAHGDEDARRLRLDPIVFLYLFALAVILAALLATQSRMGTFAGMAGCLIVVIVAFSRVPGLWVRGIVFLPLLLFLLGAAFFVYGQDLFERLGSIESSADVRIDLYHQIVDMIAARPWLGYGGGSFDQAYPLFHLLPVSPDLVWDRAHNSYLALFSELGLFAGTIPLLLLLLGLRRVVSGLAGASVDWSVKATGLGVILVAALHSLSDFSLEIQANTIMLLFLTGLGVARLRPKI